MRPTGQSGYRAWHMKRVSLVFVMAVVVGCGGPSDEELLDLANRDPRCVSACTEVEPDVMGAGDSCNTTSRVQCLDECEVRIAGTSTVCANCGYELNGLPVESNERKCPECGRHSFAKE